MFLQSSTHLSATTWFAGGDIHSKHFDGSRHNSWNDGFIIGNVTGAGADGGADDDTMKSAMYKNEQSKFGGNELK
jgi:hypothetical protein